MWKRKPDCLSRVWPWMICECRPGLSRCPQRDVMANNSSRSPPAQADMATEPIATAFSNANEMVAQVLEAL